MNDYMKSEYKRSQQLRAFSFCDEAKLVVCFITVLAAEPIGEAIASIIERFL